MDLVDGTFVATIKESNFNPKLLQKIYEYWLNERAQVFEDRAEKYSKNLEYQQVK
jgi:hypothetical protein